MRFLDRLFGKRSAADELDRDELDEELDDIRPTEMRPIDGPPELVRAVELQRGYWTYDANEYSELESRGLDRLGRRDLLRLHHLRCLQRLIVGGDRAVTAQQCRATAERLAAADSPYRPRPALIWQRRPAQPNGGTEPNLEGELVNASLTHLGCVEVCRLDAAGQPVAIDFVAFHELAEVGFAVPDRVYLLRSAKLFYEDNRSEIVALPLLYGPTWAIGKEPDRNGTMTRFVADLGDDGAAPLPASSIGVGHQDFFVGAPDGGRHLVGLGSMRAIVFPLDVSDPRFDEKARARGMDPDHVRRQIDA